MEFLWIFERLGNPGPPGWPPWFKCLEKSDNLHDPVNHSGMEGGGGGGVL